MDPARAARAPSVSPLSASEHTPTWRPSACATSGKRFLLLGWSFGGGMQAICDEASGWCHARDLQWSCDRVSSSASLDSPAASTQPWAGSQATVSGPKALRAKVPHFPSFTGGCCNSLPKRAFRRDTSAHGGWASNATLIHSTSRTSDRVIE